MAFKQDFDVGDIHENAEFDARQLVARYHGEFIAWRHQKRVFAKTTRTIEAISDWFEELNSAYSSARSVFSPTRVRAMDSLSIYYERLMNVAMSNKPKKLLMDRILKVVELFEQLYFDSMQSITYFYKMSPAKRSANESMDYYSDLIVDTLKKKGVIKNDSVED